VGVVVAVVVVVVVAATVVFGFNCWPQCETARATTEAATSN